MWCGGVPQASDTWAGSRVHSIGCEEVVVAGGPALSVVEKYAAPSPNC